MIASRTRRGWTTGSDYRVICQCQKHRGDRGVVRRAVTIVSRGVAILLSIPVAVTAFDLPIAAMNIKSVSLDSLRASSVRVAPAPRKPAAPQKQAAALPIFTTDSMREKFLTPGASTPSMEVFKEEYFRKQVPFGDIIYREARRNGLAPELVAAMVHTESDFRPGLVSHKSAQGLMQIVPDTARILGVANPFDPAQNIAAGTRYFKTLLVRFNGDERIALAAYNAGPTNVARFGGVPPFRETQAYIEKVNRRHNRYRERVRSTYAMTMRKSAAK